MCTTEQDLQGGYGFADGATLVNEGGIDETGLEDGELVHGKQGDMDSRKNGADFGAGTGNGKTGQGLVDEEQIWGELSHLVKQARCVFGLTHFFHT
jgi:hypothetical protein